MKGLVDAHLPRPLVYWLRQAGYDAIHTRDLPLGNRTPDAVINDLSLREYRVLVTKDGDFIDAFLMHHQRYNPLLNEAGWGSSWSLNNDLSGRAVMRDSDVGAPKWP